MKFKSFTIIFFMTCFCFANSDSSAKNIDESVSPEQIKTLIENLNNKDVLLQNDSAENLIAIGTEAINAVIKDFGSDNYTVRKKKVYIVGKIGGEEAISFLLRAVEDPDEGVKTTAAHALLNLSDKFSLLDEVKKMKLRPSVDRQIIDDLINSIIYKEVESEIYHYVSPDGSSGYFEGQFSKLQEKWKEEAILPVLNIFINKDYRYIHVDLNNNEYIALQMRFLAGEALADLKECYTDALRRKVRGDLVQMKYREISINPADKYLSELIDNILYHLGYTADFDREVQNLKNQLLIDPNNTELLFDLGMKYLRIRKVDEGIMYLKRAVEIAPDSGLTYYNLACAYSIGGKIEDAVMALEKAIDYGYEDLDWMLKDGDLRNIRKHPKFEELVKRLEKKKKG